MIRVSVTASIEDMSKAVRRAGAKEIERRANRYGQLMVEEVIHVLVARGINLNRPDHRRRSNGPRLSEGWGYHVEGDTQSFPILLTMTSNGNTQLIEWLDQGTSRHTIRAGMKRGSGGKFSGGRGVLQFPPGGAVDGPPWVYRPEVSHPGSTKARGFIRQAMSNVIGSARARAR